MSNLEFALYVHIPYCKHKCPYCDFNTYAVKSIPESEYCQALLAEFTYRMQSEEWSGRKISSIYFGGGTPSIFSSSALEKLVVGFADHFGQLQEFSLEANPEDIEQATLEHFQQFGANRISFGAQSLQAKNLRQLGRTHTPEDCIRAVQRSRQAGFQNINLDLMFGIPEQTLADLELDLQAYKALAVEHVSAYNLTVEPGTTFHQRQHSGSLQLPIEDNIIAMFHLVKSELESYGFAQYEISNFAQPGKESRHNLAYWKAADYLGLGAGAHSYCTSSTNPFGRRWSNLATPAAYMQSALQDGAAQAWQEILDRDSAMFEYLFLGLRLNSGITLTDFYTRFSHSLKDTYAAKLDQLINLNLVNLTDCSLTLTDQGRLLSDSVFELLSCQT